MLQSYVCVLCMHLYIPVCIKIEFRAVLGNFFKGDKVEFSRNWVGGEGGRASLDAKFSK